MTDGQTAHEVARSGAHAARTPLDSARRCATERSLSISSPHPCFGPSSSKLYQVSSSDPGKIPTPLSSLSRLAHGEPRAGLYRDGRNTLSTVRLCFWGV